MYGKNLCKLDGFDLKIAFDHQIFGWQTYGGISRYMYELAKELSCNSHNAVTVVSPLYVNKYLQSVPKQFKVIGWPIRPIGRTGRIIRMLNSLVVGSLFKRLKPDIVHETYFAFKGKAPKKSKVVLTVFDMIHERFPEHFSKLDPTSKEKAAAVARADHVICISRQTQKDLIELLHVDPAKTTVVHLGFSLTTDTVELMNRTDNRPYLLYVGMRGGYKNFDGFLRAVALSPLLMHRFQIICFGGGPFTGPEQTLLRSLNFSDSDVVQFSGSDAILAGLYKQAHAFIYPSLYEGFGIPPLEAMGFDCPVACSNTSSIPEVVGDAGIYFNPSNIDEIRLVIEQVTSDKQLRNSLIAKGRERVLEFSWGKCAAETLEVYRKALVCGY